jgi:ARG and Rhodanese-Phosphatase-superfamily-associated Protein domain
MMSTTIAELLAGCELGPVQSVGRMQVVPLLAGPAAAADGFVAPPACRTATSAYGTLVFDNPHELPLLVPCHAGFVVPQAAQDHAMAHAALVAGKASAAFDTALCVQETQGGTIGAGEHAMVILPFPLREPALAVRHQRDYSRLWPAVRTFNADAGLQAVGNLAVFFSHFA